MVGGWWCRRAGDGPQRILLYACSPSLKSMAPPDPSGTVTLQDSVLVGHDAYSAQEDSRQMWLALHIDTKLSVTVPMLCMPQPLGWEQ